MDLHSDFADLCSLLNANGVEFPIVGGYAVAFHGAPRFTGDLDIRSIQHSNRCSELWRRSRILAFRRNRSPLRMCFRNAGSYNSGISLCRSTL